MRAAPPRPVQPDPDGGFGVADAFRTLWRERDLRAVTVATTLSHIGAGAFAIALAAAALDHGRAASAAGVAMTVYAVTALAGSFALTRRGDGIDPTALVLVATGLGGAVTMVMGLAAWPLVVALAAVLGLLDGPILVGTYRARTAGSPEHLRASVFTVGASLKLAASSIGAVVLGRALAEREASWGLVVVGATGVVAAAAGAVGRTTRRAPDAT